MNGHLPTCQTGKRVSGTSTACSFCDHSANVLSVSYTLHMRFVRYTSVTRTFVDRSFFITCSVRMRFSRLPRRSSPPLRRLPTPDKPFLHFFCPFGVRYLYPVICDSTIRSVSHLTDKVTDAERTEKNAKNVYPLMEVGEF